jgi:anaphase-promoting complex subunit 2
VSTIKALAHVDPGGTILGAVGDPIRAYLRERKDTIRCIVTMLTNDEEDAAAQSLFAELGNTDAVAEVGWRERRGGSRGRSRVPSNQAVCIQCLGGDCCR